MEAGRHGDEKKVVDWPRFFVLVPSEAEVSGGGAPQDQYKAITPPRPKIKGVTPSAGIKSSCGNR